MFSCRRPLRWRVRKSHTEGRADAGNQAGEMSAQLELGRLTLLRLAGICSMRGARGFPIGRCAASRSLPPSGRRQEHLAEMLPPEVMVRSRTSLAGFPYSSARWERPGANLFSERGGLSASDKR